MIYDALEQFLTATATAQSGIEAFRFDYNFEMNNSGFGSNSARAFPALFVEPPDGLFGDNSNKYPSGIENGRKELGLRFTIVDPENTRGAATGDTKGTRGAHLDELEGLLRDFITEVLNPTNPALGGLRINRIGRDNSIQFRTHQGVGEFLLVTCTIFVSVAVPCAGGDFTYVPVGAPEIEKTVVLSGTSNIERTEWIETATYTIDNIATDDNAASTTLYEDGVEVVAGDTVNAGALMELEVERSDSSAKYSTTTVINGTFIDTTETKIASWEYPKWKNLNGFDTWKQDNLSITETGLICTQTSGFCWAQGQFPFHYDAEIRWVAGNNVYVGFSRSEITPTSVNDLEFAVRDGGNNIRVVESGVNVYSKSRRGAETFGIRVGSGTLEYLVNDTVVYTTAISINSTDIFYLYAAYTATTGSDVTGINFMNAKGLRR